MVKDFHEIVTEAGRHKNYSRKGRGPRDIEDLPDRAAMRPKNCWKFEFKDKIEPLRRWLRAQVGRNWNKVWSELCESLPSNSSAGNHIHDHIKWEVERYPTIEDGVVYRSVSRWRMFLRKGDLYVDSVGRLMMVRKDPPARKVASDPYTVKTDSKTIYICEDGKRLAVAAVCDYVTSKVLYRASPFEPWKLVGRDTVDLSPSGRWDGPQHIPGPFKAIY